MGKGGDGRVAEPADLLPASGVVNMTFEADEETVRKDVRLLLARQSFLVGQVSIISIYMQIVAGLADDAAIRRLSGST